MVVWVVLLVSNSAALWLRVDCFRGVPKSCASDATTGNTFHTPYKNRIECQLTVCIAIMEVTAGAALDADAVEGRRLEDVVRIAGLGAGRARHLN